MAADPVILALETTQRRGGIALRGRDGVITSERFDGRDRRDDAVMPAIDRLVTAAGLVPGDLGIVGVSIGPGGFTGVRIGVTTARMLGECTGAVLVPVPTAVAVAQGHDGDLDPGRDVVVVLAVKRGSFWATRLRREDGLWTPAAPAGIVAAGDLDPCGTQAVLADEHLPEDARIACAQAGVPVIEPGMDPVGVLLAAGHMATRGHAVDPLQLRPLYPRKPEAVSLWDRRHGGGQ